MENVEIDESLNTWCEKAYIETAEHIIKGEIYMPRIGKKSRLFSELLNSNKNFIAVKNCSVEYKFIKVKEIDKYNFIQVNLSTILLIRPLDD